MVKTGSADTAVGGQQHGLRQGLAQLLDLVNLVAPTTSRVLVVGAQAGELLDSLRAAGYDRLSVSELTQFGHADESFDIVILHGILETAVQSKKLMTAVQRVLRPGGRALIVVPHQGFSESSLRWNLGRYFDVLSIDDGRDSHYAPPLFFVNCQKVTRTAGFWDLVTRQRKF